VFFHTVVHPSLAIQAFFSFFGHFGVQLFVFLSAYGLARSHWDDPSSWAGFLWGRVKKLYPAFGLVVFAWFVGASVVSGSLSYAGHVGLQLILMFLGLSTVVGYGLPPIGPWWFIPFIVQFYALYPLLRWMTKRWGWPSLAVLAAVCVTVSYLLDPWLLPHNLDLFLTPIGRMPVLCFGILAARYPIRLRGWVALVAGALLLAGSRYALLWPLTFPAAAVLAVWGYLQTRGLLRRSWSLRRIGEYSLLIFLLNGIVRDYFVPLARGPASQLVLGCVSALISVAIAAALQEFGIGPMTAPRKRLQPSAASVTYINAA
jgi:peptidoglycan/LPS O-acetylase OafA/YrhL